MAKQFMDAKGSDEFAAIALQGGGALTLTNDVRILYEDTKTTNEIVAAIDKIRARIIQTEIA